MGTRIIYFIASLVLATLGVFSQESYLNSVKFENQTTVKEGDRVLVNMDILLDALKISSNDMLVLAPMLSSNESTDSLKLAPVFVTGNRRGKVMERNAVLGNASDSYPVPQSTIDRKNGSAQVVSYSTVVPFSNWMKNASLVVTESVKGCADCSSNLGDVLVADRVLPMDYIPTYKLTYVVPEVEPVKGRSESHSATFNYVVGKYDLHRDYKNNASEFDKVDNVINEVKNNKDLTITEFTVSGYASPEGNFNSNRTLSANRANSFAEYLNKEHGIQRNQLKVEGFGEDWTGLKEVVTASSLSDKNEVLRIIDNVSNPDARDAELRKLSGGQTYQTLLNTYYPPLRRTDYNIAYNVRAFSVEEGREVVKTNPKLLSLNEMYLVAQSYPATSKEFKEMFDIATRLYPEEPIAIINSAAADIENGNLQAAIDRLNKIESDARAWNNLGVAYARMGELDKAKTYFERAAARGDKNATANLEELGKTITN